MPDHLRLAVLLAAWCQIRRGELIGLERRDFDMLHRTVRVERTVNRIKGGLIVGPPKTEAGRRIVTLPPHILPDVVRHLDTFVGSLPTDPVLVGLKGGRLSPLALYEAFDDARHLVGRPDLHFHDLRHFGATMLAISGATTRELMARVGHSSPVAALSISTQRWIATPLSLRPFLSTFSCPQGGPASDQLWSLAGCPRDELRIAGRLRRSSES